MDIFTPMQLDVFHAMWELYHAEARGARPPTAATRVDRNTLDRAHALSEVLVGTVVWKRVRRPRRKDMPTPWRHLRLQDAVLLDPPPRRRLGGAHEY